MEYDKHIQFWPVADAHTARSTNQANEHKQGHHRTYFSAISNSIFTVL